MAEEKVCAAGHVVGENEAVCSRDGQAPVVDNAPVDAPADNAEQSSAEVEAKAEEVKDEEEAGEVSEEAEEEAGEESEVEEQQEAIGKRKYKVLNESGISVEGSDDVHAQGSVVELDPSSEQTKHFVEGGFVEQIADETVA